MICAEFQPSALRWDEPFTAKIPLEKKRDSWLSAIFRFCCLIKSKKKSSD
jgi:hypothetical protein